MDISENSVVGECMEWLIGTRDVGLCCDLPFIADQRLVDLGFQAQWGCDEEGWMTAITGLKYRCNIRHQTQMKSHTYSIF
jgi:hypothetical protein